MPNSSSPPPHRSCAFPSLHSQVHTVHAALDTVALSLLRECGRHDGGTSQGDPETELRAAVARLLRRRRQGRKP